jgi:hypothetical protein
VAGLENPGVAALSAREARADLLKQLVGGLAVRDVTAGEPAIVQRAGLGLGDQLLDERTKLLGFRLGRLDRAALDQRFGQAPHQRQLLLAGAPKLPADFTVTHSYTSSSSSAPTVATLRFGGVP